MAPSDKEADEGDYVEMEEEASVEWAHLPASILAQALASLRDFRDVAAVALVGEELARFVQYGSPVSNTMCGCGAFILPLDRLPKTQVQSKADGFGGMLNGEAVEP